MERVMAKLQELDRDHVVEIDPVAATAAILDISGQVLCASDTHVSTYGYDPLQDNSEPLILIVHPDDREEVRMQFIKMLQQGCAIACDARIRANDEQWIEARIKGRPIVSVNKTLGYLVTSRPKNSVDLTALFSARRGLLSHMR